MTLTPELVADTRCEVGEGHCGMRTSAGSTDSTSHPATFAAMTRQRTATIEVDSALLLFLARTGQSRRSAATSASILAECASARIAPFPTKNASSRVEPLSIARP